MNLRCTLSFAFGTCTSEMIEKVLIIYTGGSDQDVLASLLSSLLSIHLYIKLTFKHIGDLCLQNSVFGWMETVIA